MDRSNNYEDGLLSSSTALVDNSNAPTVHANHTSQQSFKRKINTSAGEVLNGSVVSLVTTNEKIIEPVAKKKFAPTIPHTRPSKQSVETSQLQKKTQLHSRTAYGMARVQGRDPKQLHSFNQARKGNTSSGPPRFPVPIPYKRPELIQTEGCLFGQGVFEDGKNEKKSKNQVEKPAGGSDPMMNALNIIDNLEIIGDLKNSNVGHSSINSVETESSSHITINELVLERNPQPLDEELVIVNRKLTEKLKFHQVEGVKFMWNACFRTEGSSGCVLAHCMGLGKSLQVVTLAHTVLTHAVCRITRVMVVGPLSTVLNWENEFRIWMPSDTALDVIELTRAKSNAIREKKVSQWFQTGGILIIGYEMFRTLTKEKKKPSAKDRTSYDLFRRAFLDPGPDVLFCDEGHLLKNEESELYKTMNKISTRRRIMLTGTPLQNNLFEFYTMVQFVKPGQLGTKIEFGKRFATALEKGQTADSTAADVRAMKRRALILHKLLENIVQRFDSNVLAPFLPPKYEYVISVKMSELQIQLYRYYLERYTKSGSTQPIEGVERSRMFFCDFQELSRVWTHPKALLLARRRRESKTSSLGNDNTKRGVRTKTGNKKDEDFAELEDDFGEETTTEFNASSNDQWWSHIITGEEIEKKEHSGKLILLLDIVQQCEIIGDKLLVFSQSLTTLDLIEEFLAVKGQTENEDVKSEKKFGTWVLNTDYFRLDGATSSDQRQKWCSAFNDPKNPRARLFIISTRAGGIGINLIGANRAVIFDASWNPSMDIQSVFRIYRLGQKKPCFIYRFVALGTMEEKVYYRQIAKLSMSRTIIDDEQMDRHFGSGDLTDLYTFNVDGQLSLSAPLLAESRSEQCQGPQDQLLNDLVVRQKQWFGSYREHDSLLQNRPEEYLEEAEQKAIWGIFEKEKEIQSRNVL